MSDLERALHELLLEIATVWQTPRLLGSSSKSQPKIVVTHAEGGPVLPRTKRPIRGAKGVKVDVREGMLPGAELAESLVSQAFSEPWRYQDDLQIQEARAPLNARIQEVFSIFEKIDHLPERLFESMRLKHYEPDEVRRRVRGNDAEASTLREVFWKLQLASAVGRALALQGFDPVRKDAFEGWREVAELVARDFELLASRKRNRYRAVICMNSPLIDEENPTPIAYLRVGEEPIEVCLSGATDELLTELLRHAFDIPVGEINTVISFDFTVDVDASVDTYLGWYPKAAFLAEHATDILRLICTDDVGVLTLEIFEPEWATPGIRKTYERSYSIDLAPYHPKRFRFGPPSEQILSEAQINDISRLVPQYVTGDIDVKGLDTAMKRFRASFDRYQPSDPERLLEAAIAFEAVLLNDAGANHQELGYRLRLRAARFLTEDLDERLRIFELLRDLYNFRSRIAHGETLGDMRPKDREKLEAVIQESPGVLRKVLLKIMETADLRGLTKEQLSSWWQQVELG